MADAQSVHGFDWLTLVWAALMPLYAVLIAVFPAQGVTGKLAYVAGSVIWCIVVFLLISRGRAAARAAAVAERNTREEREKILDAQHEEVVRLLRAGIPAPTRVEPSPVLEQLVRQELSLRGGTPAVYVPAQMVRERVNHLLSATAGAVIVDAAKANLTLNLAVEDGVGIGDKTEIEVKHAPPSESGPQ